jgi:predicted SnoaL-like aldol condensation-catalyzing enzyme
MKIAQSPWLAHALAILAGILLCGGTAAAQQGPSRPDENRRMVLEFYDKALNQKDFLGASAYFGPNYIQHNPAAGDGIEGFKAFVQLLRDKFPNSTSEIKRAFAEGDYVILHVHAIREPGTRGLAIVDIFRLEGGKIVEHWDVRQDIPEVAANANGMF